MSINYALIAIAITFIFYMIRSKKRDPYKEHIANFGLSLRNEFPDYSDELTDEYAHKILNIRTKYARQVEGAIKRKLLIERSEDKSNEDLELENEILTKLLLDQKQAERHIAPPRFKEYINSISQEELDTRMMRVLDGTMRLEGNIDYFKRMKEFRSE